MPSGAESVRATPSDDCDAGVAALAARRLGGASLAVGAAAAAPRALPGAGLAGEAQPLGPLGLGLAAAQQEFHCFCWTCWAGLLSSFRFFLWIVS